MDTEEAKEAIGYARVSTVDQAKNGVSLEMQEEKITAWAKLHNYEIIHIFHDQGISGIKNDRPGFMKAMDAVINNKATLIVYSLSRFSRSTADTMQLADKLRKEGCNLVSLSEKIDTTTAAGKMVFRMLAVLNEFERDQIRERTIAGLNQLRMNGRKLGGEIPYGYNLEEGNILVPNTYEQDIINEIVFLKTEKNKSLRYIAKDLNDKGYTTKKGKQFHPQTINNIINYHKQEQLFNLKEDAL